MVCSDRDLLIGITPEMALAGENCIYEFGIIDGGMSRSEIQTCAKEIFRVMASLAPSK